MILANRTEAGLSLSWRLAKYADRNDVVILGIPRGGVPAAFELPVRSMCRLIFSASKARRPRSRGVGTWSDCLRGSPSP
jgi:hypothetical protein